jgi:hypothetical protein
LGKLGKTATYLMAALVVLGVVSIGTFSITSTRAAAGITTWPWAVDPSCYVGGEYVCNIPDGKPSNVGIPDLREAVPQQIGLQNTNHHSYLRISTAIGNTGDGQWQMRAVIPATTTDPQGANQQLLNPDGTIWKEYLVSEFVYHPEHKHFHIADVSAYDLYSADGPADRNPSDNANTGIGARKVTFCLIDWVKIGDNSPDNQRAYSSCEGDFQGVSPGWTNTISRLRGRSWTLLHCQQDTTL